MARNRILGYRAQTRSRVLAYTVTFALLLVLLACLQVAFFGKLRPFGAVPDLMICTVLIIAYFCGQYAGAITGIAAGFLIEAIGSLGVSILPVAFMIGGYVVGYYAHTLGQKRYPVYLLYLGGALILRAGLTVIYAAISYESVNLLHILWESVLPEALGTALAGILLYFPIGGICRLLARKA